MGHGNYVANREVWSKLRLILQQIRVGLFNGTENVGRTGAKSLPSTTYGLSHA